MTAVHDSRLIFDVLGGTLTDAALGLAIITKDSKASPYSVIVDTETLELVLLDFLMHLKHEG